MPYLGHMFATRAGGVKTAVRADIEQTSLDDGLWPEGDMDTAALSNRNRRESSEDPHQKHLANSPKQREPLLLFFRFRGAVFDGHTGGR